MDEAQLDGEAERRGEERAAAAHERGEEALGRARNARREAEQADDPRVERLRRAEAEKHEDGARVQAEAEVLQEEHAEEARQERDGSEDPTEAERR